MEITYKKEILSGKHPPTDDIVSILLENRNIKDIDAFLHPPHPRTLTLSSFTKSYTTAFKRVVKFLKEIKKSNSTIVVYTDYDADGITGGSILYETLKLLGFNVVPYVPHRIHEGYGFSKKGIDAIKKLYNPALVISVDHGITAKDKIAYAKKLGIPIVVTDHHLKPEEAPTDALAIFHIPALSGSGVSYVFSKELYEYFGKYATQINRDLLKKHFDCDYLAIAAIGTVADLVPLVGPSRAIVKHGLAAFSKVERVGIREILRACGIGYKPVTPYEIGFMIAPRINAIGRLEHAIDALYLLCTDNRTQATELTSKIGKRNIERQDLVESAIKEAEKQIEENKLDTHKLIILTSHTWHEGIIGLIASRVVEKYYRPVVVLTKTDGFLKGSARSIPAFHITDFLRNHRDLLIDVGGHKQAAGFTIDEKNVEKFIKTLQKNADLLITEKDLVRKLEVDIRLPVSYLSLDLVDKLNQLEPFGVGNAKPLFLSSVAIKNARTMGKENKHLKFYSQNNVEFVAFSSGHRYPSFSQEEIREVVYHPEINVWDGLRRVSAKVVYF